MSAIAFRPRPPSSMRAALRAMLCPICGHHVEDADYWAGDKCLRCALRAEIAFLADPGRPRQHSPRRYVICIIQSTVL